MRLGGCWWELTLSPANGQTVQELGRDLYARDETRAARSWVDRRTVCTGFHVVGDRLTAYVQYERPFGW